MEKSVSETATVHFRMTWVDGGQKKKPHKQILILRPPELPTHFVLQMWSYTSKKQNQKKNWNPLESTCETVRLWGLTWFWWFEKQRKSVKLISTWIGVCFPCSLNIRASSNKWFSVTLKLSLHLDQTDRQVCEQIGHFP